MYAPIEIDGRMYRVRLTVRDYTGIRTGGRTNLHALETHEIEITSVEMEKRPDVGSPTPDGLRATGRITLSPRHYGLSIAYPLSVCQGQSGEWLFSQLLHRYYTIY